MNKAELEQLIGWFDVYTTPFLNTDYEGMKNIQLKIEHTKKVCEAMNLLAIGENLSENESLIASAVAILHDVGRFLQYKKWRTFLDRDSDNHARIAVDVIRAENVLSNIDSAERLLIEEAVRFHNMLTPPFEIKSPTRLYIDLIRDADKLDIWRVFVELLALPEKERASAATLGLPDAPEKVSNDCIQALLSGSIVRLDSISCLNDFKLLQISWVYDLTFCSSRKIVSERGYIQALASTLPKREEIDLAVQKALDALSA